MEDISPTLIFLWDLKRALEKSQSVSVGIKVFLNKKLKHAFYFQVERWWMSQNNASSPFDKSKLCSSRAYLLEIAELGLKGQSILEILKSYECELVKSCENEVEQHIAKLPLLLMFPLMGLIFPSMMLLLIAPLLKSFQF